MSEDRNPQVDIEELAEVMEPQDRIQLESGHVAVIYPIGYKHLKKFSKEFSGALSMLNTMQVPSELMDIEGGGEIALNMYMKSAVPYVINNLLSVVEETVVIECDENLPPITLDDLPHWEFPKIIHSWILKSFGEERKISPWIAVVEDLMVRFTGQGMDLKTKFKNLFTKKTSTSD